MIKYLFFLFGFSLGFTVEITVQAAERVQLRKIEPVLERANHDSSALLEQPENCVTTAEKCAVRIGERRKLVIEPIPGREWTLTENTIVIRMSPERLRFVEGSIRVKGETTIETEQGEIGISGEAFIDRRGSHVTVINVGDQPVSFKGRGWATSQEIPSGLEAHIDLPNVRSGQTSVNLPLPFDFDAQVVREARVFSGAKEDFPKRLEFLAELRASAAVDAAKFHKAAIERKIATVTAREADVKEVRAKRELRDKEIRALYRRKVLNPE